VITKKISRFTRKYSCNEFTVLAVIQEKLNNPSPDDPFEPEIAAVYTFRSSMQNEGTDCAA
jgi:hypothetical protein